MRVFVVTPIALAMLLLPGNARADTLQEALAIAYQTNPSLTGARAALRATDEGVPIALAAAGRQLAQPLTIKSFFCARQTAFQPHSEPQMPVPMSVFLFIREDGSEIP